jgi:hypothetical protein
VALAQHCDISATTDFLDSASNGFEKINKYIHQQLKIIIFY